MPRLQRLLAVLLLAGVSAGCATDQQVIAQAADVHKQLEPSVVTDPQLTAYVQKVGDRIVASAQDLHARGEVDAEPWMFENIQFHLVASPTMNAFTTGGKHVYLYSELFENSDNEAAFAAVVGHEFGHIVGKHVQNSMNKQMAILAASGAAGLAAAAVAEDGKRLQTGSTVAGVAATAGSALGIPFFTRSTEREADDLGFDFYVNAGYPPEDFPDFFKTMIAKGYAEGSGGLNAYLGSHPELKDRVAVAERRAKEISPERERRLAKPPIADESEFQRLQSRSQPLTLAAAKEAKQQAAAAKAGGNASAFLESQALLAGFPKCVGEPERGE